MLKLFFIVTAFIVYTSIKIEPVDASCCCCCCKPCCCCCCPCCPCCCCCKCCCKPCCCCCPCCCGGGRRKRALISAAARGALGNAALVPRVNEPNVRNTRCAQCEGQQCGSGSTNCQECKPEAAKPQQKCRQCTPEEEKECSKKMAPTHDLTPSKSSLGGHLSRLFKHAMHKKSDSASNDCPQAKDQKCKC